MRKWLWSRLTAIEFHQVKSTSQWSAEEALLIPTTAVVSKIRPLEVRCLLLSQPILTPPQILAPPQRKMTTTHWPPGKPEVQLQICMRIWNQKTHIENWYDGFVINMLQSWIFGQDTKFITKKMSTHKYFWPSNIKHKNVNVPTENWWRNSCKAKLTKFLLK